MNLTDRMLVVEWMRARARRADPACSVDSRTISEAADYLDRTGDVDVRLVDAATKAGCVWLADPLDPTQIRATMPRLPDSELVRQADARVVEAERLQKRAELDLVIAKADVETLRTHLAETTKMLEMVMGAP